MNSYVIHSSTSTLQIPSTDRINLVLSLTKKICMQLEREPNIIHLVCTATQNEKAQNRLFYSSSNISQHFHHLPANAFNSDHVIVRQLHFPGVDWSRRQNILRLIREREMTASYCPVMNKYLLTLVFSGRDTDNWCLKKFNFL